MKPRIPLCAMLALSTALGLPALLVAQAPEEQSVYGTGAGVSGVVQAAVAQPDGKVILGGNFDSVNRIPRGNLARIHPDGTLDRSIFDGPRHGVTGEVHALALDAAGGIIVGGDFSRAAEKQVLNLARFNPDGSIDAEFAGGLYPNGTVYALLVQPDGSVIVAGQFSTFGGKPRGNIARIKPDGSLDDPLMDPEGALRGRVNALALEVPESVVGAGDFSLEKQPTRGIFRLQPATD